MTHPSSEQHVHIGDDDHYLGDGLYASFDGWQIRLFASDGIGVTNEVFLEPSVLAAFEQFVARIEEGRRE